MIEMRRAEVIDDLSRSLKVGRVVGGSVLYDLLFFFPGDGTVVGRFYKYVGIWKGIRRSSKAEPLVPMCETEIAGQNLVHLKRIYNQARCSGTYL